MLFLALHPAAAIPPWVVAGACLELVYIPLQLTVLQVSPKLVHNSKIKWYKLAEVSDQLKLGVTAYHS
jgi:hypothetical protein